MATIRSGSGPRLGERWAVLPLITILCLGLFSIAASAGWADCVQAWLDGENAVRLLVRANEKGTVKFTIGKNVIRFAVTANVPLDTGRLRLNDDVATVIVELFNANGAATAKCEIPVGQLTNQDEDFCCDREGPDVRIEVDPVPGPGGWIRTAVTLRITAEDKSGIAEIAYQSPIISDGNVVRVGPDRLELSDGGHRAETRRELYPQYTPDGRHELECWATDAVGNVSERIGIELQFDFTPPLTSVGIATSAEGAGFSWEISDALSGVRECRVTLVAGSAEHLLSTSPTGDRSLTANEFGAGSHEVRIWAIDQAGNQASDSWFVSLETQTCSISGQVLDASTGQPVPGVTASIDQTGASQTTGSEGRFSFTGLDPGYYSLRFAKSGAYEPGQAIVQVDSGPLEIPVELTPVKPEEPSVSLSWTPDPADSSSEMTVGIDDLVHLYVRAPEGSTRYICYDAADNMYESQAYFLGTALDLSIYMKTLPEEAWRDPSGCDVPAREFVAMSGATVVRIQAIARMSNGSIVTSGVLTLYILGTS